MRPKTQSSNQSDLSQTPNLTQSKNAAWDALHVSPIGGVLAGIFYLAGILGAVLMDGKVSDGMIGVYVTVMILIGVVSRQDLEDAMSRQAQAERERQARVILGESEKQIASSFCRSLAGLMPDNPDCSASARHEHAV